MPILFSLKMDKMINDTKLPKNKRSFPLPFKKTSLIRVKALQFLIWIQALKIVFILV